MGFGEEEEVGRGEPDHEQSAPPPPPPRAAPTYVSLQCPKGHSHEYVGLTRTALLVLSVVCQPSLELSPFPDAQTLASTVQSMVAPIFPSLDPHSQMGPEDVRQVPGLGQVLVDEER